MSTVLLFFYPPKLHYRVFQKKDYTAYPFQHNGFPLVENPVENVYNFW